DDDPRDRPAMPLVGERVELAIAAVFARAIDQLATLELPKSHVSLPAREPPHSTRAGRRVAVASVPDLLYEPIGGELAMRHWVVASALLIAACQQKPAQLTYEGADYKTDAAKVAHGKRLAVILDCTGCHGSNLQ